MPLSGVVSGKNGTIQLATLGGTVVRIKNWSFQEQGSAIPCKDSGDTDEYVPHVPGKAKTTTGSFDQIVRYGALVGELALHTSYVVLFILDDTSGDEMYYTGTIILTSKGKTVDVEGDNVVMTNFSFTVNGELALTDNSQA
jgi:hypothetical protein